MTAHVDDVAVFGYGQQWSKVSSDKKALRSMPNKGRAAALFTVKRGCAEKETREREEKKKEISVPQYL